MAVHWGDFGPAGSNKVQLKPEEENDLVMPKVAGLVEERKPLRTKKGSPPPRPECHKGETKWDEVMTQPNPKLADKSHLRPDISAVDVVKVMKSAAGIPVDKSDEKK